MARLVSALVKNCIHDIGAVLATPGVRREIKSLQRPRNGRRRDAEARSEEVDWDRTAGFLSDLLVVGHSRSPVDLNLLVALIVAFGRALQRLLRPARSVVTLGLAATRDLTRPRSELLVENTLLRQQIIVLRRSIERPRLHRDERLLLLILTRLTRSLLLLLASESY